MPALPAVSGMRAVSPFSPPTTIPHLVEIPEPVPGPGEVLVRVAAAGLNRADLLQLAGRYPPPPGESPVPGLECSGVVAALGPDETGFAVGQRVMALLAGGGQAELASAPVGQLMPVPETLDLIAAGGIPEVGLTAWTNLVAEGGLQAGETVLITGAASGVGTFAVQLARELGARVWVAGRSRVRLEPLLELGASYCFELDEQFASRVRKASGGAGVDLVLDLVGGEWLPQSLAALAVKGRLVLVGLMAGAAAQLDLGIVLSRRLRLAGSVLRPRGRAEKAELVRGFSEFALPRLAAGRLRPVIDRVFQFNEVDQAYGFLERGGALGKVVLSIPG